MERIEEAKRGLEVRCKLLEEIMTIVAAAWHQSNAMQDEK